MRVEAVRSDIPQPLANYTEAYCAGGLIFAAGQLPTDFTTGIPPEARTDPAFPYYGSDIKKRTGYVLNNLARTFEAAGSSLDHVVKAQVFLEDLNDFNAFDEVWKEYFSTPPARTTVGTSGLLVRDAMIEIDLIGYVPGELDCSAVTSDVPQPLANYTEAFRVGGLVFAAGQLPTDFTTGIPAAARTDPAFPYYGSDIKKRTRYVLGNLARTFEAAGSSLDHVVKAQVFLEDLHEFDAFDEVWREYFESPPARTTVGTTGLLVKDSMVEIDLIGYVPGALECTAIRSDSPQPLANYTEAYRLGDYVFAAGQVPSDFVTGIPAEARVDPAFPYYGSNIKKRTRYILDNLARTFAAAGSSLDDVVKAQVFLEDLNDFNAFDEVWKEYFDIPPARTTVGTTGLLVPDAMIEIDLIGAVRG
ncbi:MAG: RidA family protein [Defluviicoccus sp.]|nr:RidA family protein [Defluviicoccus sp.]MDE0384275.1 RidA family protein [Defluviicoccus sp.]